MVVAPGIAGLHAVGSALCGALRDHGASPEDVDEAMARLLAYGPRRVLNATSASDAAPDSITLFSPEDQAPTSSSKAPNTVYGADTPGLGGHVVGVITTRGTHWN